MRSSAGDETLELARRGMTLLMNGQADEAIKTFQQVQQQDPDSAVGYLLEADATWWKIYLTIGNLVDPDVFDVAKTLKSAYDSRFEAVLNVAIRCSSTAFTSPPSFSMLMRRIISRSASQRSSAPIS